jgi:hypothetical protein
MAYIAQNPHALAIIAALEASSGVPVGDAVAPEMHSGRYVVVYMLPGGEIDGTAADPDEWIDGRFQLTAVGRVASEARWVADKAAEAVTADGAVTVTDRTIQRVRPLDSWGGVVRDDDVTPPMFYTTRIFGLYSF